MNDIITCFAILGIFQAAWMITRYLAVPVLEEIGVM